MNIFKVISIKKLLLISVLVPSLGFAATGELSQIKGVTDNEGFTKLKSNYKSCVLKKADQYMRISNISDTIEHSQIACKREFLKIKKYMLDTAFKQEVVIALVDSVKEGIEIDLVNYIYDKKLKRR